MGDLAIGRNSRTTVVMTQVEFLTQFEFVSFSPFHGMEAEVESNFFLEFFSFVSFPQVRFSMAAIDKKHQKKGREKHSGGAICKKSG